MTLLQKIKDRQLQARKQKDSVTATSLSTLLGEIVQIGKRENKESTDTECVSVIKKFLKDLDTMLENTSELFALQRIEREKELLASFLPKQFSAEEIQEILVSHYEKGKPSMRDVMKFLKENFAGKYDGKIASTVVKNFVESL